MIYSTVNSIVLRDWKFSLTVDDVIRGQGADPTIIRTRRPALIDLAEWALIEGVPLLEPVVLASLLTLKEFRHDHIILDGDGILSGPLIQQHLATASQVCIMICTIGPQLEEISSEIMNTEPLNSLALEGVGTAAVESLANQVCCYFEDQATKTGLSTSIPLSPGMVGWSVNPGQRQIFTILDGKSIGVELNTNDMMIPRLSLTQVIGFGDSFNFTGKACDYCSLQDTCRYQDHFQHSIS
jgi:hypothetical protein